MTKRLRNRDSPASTWFGGTEFSPSAFRVSDRTTKILVKQVTSSSSDGATASTVMVSSRVSDWLGFCPPTLTVTVPAPLGALGPFGGAGALGAAAAACTAGPPHPKRGPAGGVRPWRAGRTG